MAVWLVIEIVNENHARLSYARYVSMSTFNDCKLKE